MKKDKPDIEVLKKADKLEIATSQQATYSIGNMDEYKKSFYSLKGIFDEKDDVDIDQVIAEMKQKLNEYIEDDYRRARVKTIEMNGNNVRIEEINGKLYPHVTSIIHPFGIDFDDYKLAQYASRGTIVHYLAEKFLNDIMKGKEPKIRNPKRIKKLKDDLQTIERGGLNLRWEKCNIKGYWKKYGKHYDLENAIIEEQVINEDYKYTGTADLICGYKDIKTVHDWKTSSSYSQQKKDDYFTQLAAYAKPYGAKQLLIAPLKPVNKSGYGKPIITTDVDKYWDKFVTKREEFRKIYGV